MFLIGGGNFPPLLSNFNSTISQSRGRKMVQVIDTRNNPNIVWEKLPDDYILPDEPVDNITQPLLAAALTEALELAEIVTSEMMIATNMGICTKVNDKIVVKAPDWFYVSQVFPVAEGTTRRSYTPHTEGKVPSLVMEFLSEAEGGEYSIRPSFPYGKLWFYEHILQVPIYVIFDANSGILEVRKLTDKAYQVQSLNAEGRYFIPSLNLYLGVWFGERLNVKTHWLRWWNLEGNMLLWGKERIALEQQRTEQERQRAEQEHERAEQERQRADLAEQEIARLRSLLQEKEQN